jgi:hypothetical protein
MGDTVTLVSPEGHATDVPTADAQVWISRGFKPETTDERAGRVGDVAREGNTNAVDALGQHIASTVTLGASDALQRYAGGEDARSYLNRLDTDHPYASAAGDIVGAILPSGAIGRTAKAVEGLGGATVAGAGIRGAIEGGVMGAGQGVHELALSDDLSAERIASALSSSMLYGGLVGGAAGTAGGLVEKGLGRAKAALDEHIAATAASSAIPEDLAQLDAKGLRGARETELADLETKRVPQRQQLADDLATFRGEAKDQKLWLATRGSDDAEIRTIGKQTLKADKQLDNVLDNPKALAENPKSALAALQKQEHAFEQLIAKGDDIRAAAQTKLAEEADAIATKAKAGARAGAEVDSAPRAAETADAATAAKAKDIPTSARLEALDQVPAALEKNRALQQRIREITAPHASARLSAIQDAADQLANGGRKPNLVERMLGGSVFGTASGLAAHVPVLGQIPGVAHMIGAKASEAVTNLMFGRVANATGEIAKRTSSAIGKFLDVAAKAPPVATPLATKVLSAVRYAPETHQERRARIIDTVKGTPAPEGKLADAFTKRANELRSQVAMDETGQLVMKPDARAAMADRISPIRAHAPLLADKIETTAARKLEFLASKLPKRADDGVLQTGPDGWKPSELEMRTFARYAAAAEDPGAVEERLAHGSITPEDVEAYHAIYPERAAHLQQLLIERLSDLRATLPYPRRLALSMFSGVPVDASMDPRVFAALQGNFTRDPQAEGLVQPSPAPQFGSVRKSAPQPTAAQERNG